MRFRRNRGRAGFVVLFVGVLLALVSNGLPVHACPGVNEKGWDQFAASLPALPQLSGGRVPPPLPVSFNWVWDNPALNKSLISGPRNQGGCTTYAGNDEPFALKTAGKYAAKKERNNVGVFEFETY
jgi:hypothetical protein